MFMYCDGWIASKPPSSTIVQSRLLKSRVYANSTMGLILKRYQTFNGHFWGLPRSRL
jgi:hypothetical protein